MSDVMALLDQTTQPPEAARSVHGSPRALQRLKQRQRREYGVQALGVLAILFAILSLLWLLSSLVGSGRTAFYHHVLSLEVTLDRDLLDPDGSAKPDMLRQADYRTLIEAGLLRHFPGLSRNIEDQALFRLVSTSGSANALRQMVVEDPERVGQTVSLDILVSDDVDQFLKGKLDKKVPEALRPLSNQQIKWIEMLQARGDLRARFNTLFFTAGDSRDPELAGIASAAAGSALALVVAFLIAVPIGVGAAIYLEEYAPKGRLTSFIEININNLAAVPSIVFGLLGLAVFINFFGLQRSIPLVGGMVLALRTFPTIIITTRAALQAVPQSIRDGALSIGATNTQAVFHHKVPLATPGILTGTIIGMAQALGETAPLLMIGMVAFVTEVPNTLTDPASALPVQIFLWSDNPDRAWEERTAAAILVLLGFLVVMNGLAVYLRSRFERRW